MNDAALFVLEKLESSGHQARLAGGCVRDFLLGITPKDYDVATTALPEQVLSLFEKTIPTGLAHGTITVMIEGEPIEVTTLRKDVETDGRHATVNFSSSFEEDSLRRDFTINAMYKDKYGKIYDFHNGQQHLKEKRLMFVGSAEQRIKEDYLRILRFFRFMARFELTSDLETIETIYRLQPGLAQISRERVNSELFQIFGFERSSKIIHWIQDSGIFGTVFGKFGRKNLPKDFFDAFNHLDSIPKKWRALVKLAFYLGPMTSDFSDVFLKDSKLSAEQQALLYLLVTFQYQREVLTLDLKNKLKVLETLDLLSKKVGEQALFEAVLPFYRIVADVAGLGSRLSRQGESAEMKIKEIVELDKRSRRLTTMPITGADLLALGVAQGPKLGEFLKILKNAFWEEEWSSKEEGLKYFMSKLRTID